jgi:uncharacterized zinc-type alcohol dehydrogenase-like protein
MPRAIAYAAHSPEHFAPFQFERRQTGDHDVRIEILYCGICHSDVHFAKGEWNGTIYPCVPGHEIVGRVSAVGSKVTKFQVGDLAGIGCIVDSCGECGSCREHMEQYCDRGMVGTYGGTEPQTGQPTYGGYSDHIVVDQDYVLHIRHDESSLRAIAPLLCAGITLYSPLRHWNAGPGKTVGIVGIGGLGHIGLKISRALGAHTVAFTTSPNKADEARSLGADDVLISTDPQAVQAWAGRFDLIVNTVSAAQDLAMYSNLLKRDGTLVLLGAGTEAHTWPSPMMLLHRRRGIAGSMIGGIEETQEMLDFCAKHGIVADIEMVGVEEIESAYDRIVAGKVKYRFVIDMKTLAPAVEREAA